MGSRRPAECGRGAAARAVSGRDRRSGGDNGGSAEAYRPGCKRWPFSRPLPSAPTDQLRHVARAGDFGRLGHGHAADCFAPHPVAALAGVAIKQVGVGWLAGCPLIGPGASPERRSAPQRDHWRAKHLTAGEACRKAQQQQQQQPLCGPPFPGPRNVQVACGDAHTLVVTDGGALFSFGRNQNGARRGGGGPGRWGPRPLT
jgi:hypothetical protein